MSNPQQQLVSINMTNFFNRELFMYSLGDWKFKKPKSLRKMAYTLGFLLIWTLPIVLIFGIQLNVVFAVIALAPPILLGQFASQPVFGGKTLFDFIKTTAGFVGEPRAWTDLNDANAMDRQVLDAESEIWVSRRRELQYVADLRERRKP